MVSAYNLHFDVLGLIFSYLSGNDLISVALVSKAFLNGATPRLYHSLVFSHAQAKKYPKIVSPFKSLLLQPSLGVYVRVCDIAALPLYKGVPHQEFLSECIRALGTCPNLTRFKLAPNVLPGFLPTLTEKEKLKVLHANGSLTISQAHLLLHLRDLQNIRLDHASWCLLNLFPRWLSVTGSSLTYLAFVFTPDLNETILEEILSHLPNLRTLHIRNCMKIDHPTVFKLIRHTPLLESISVTTWESASTSTTLFAEVPNLQHLQLDTRNSFVPESVVPLWSGIIAHTRASGAPLQALTLQVSDKMIIPDPLVNEIIDAFGDTLAALRFVKCKFTIESLANICRECRRLEKLTMHVDFDDDFVHALAKSSALQVLVDERDPHSHQGSRASLKHSDVKSLMTAIPTLRHIVSDCRSWKGSDNADNLQITLVRLRKSELPSVITFT